MSCDLLQMVQSEQARDLVQSREDVYAGTSCRQHALDSATVASRAISTASSGAHALNAGTTIAQLSAGPPSAMLRSWENFGNQALGASPCCIQA